MRLFKRRKTDASRAPQREHVRPEVLAREEAEREASRLAEERRQASAADVAAACETAGFYWPGSGPAPTARLSGHSSRSELVDALLARFRR